MRNDTIAARATPRGSSALAVLRVSGPEAVEIVGRLFVPAERLRALRGHACVVGELRDGDDAVDRVVVTRFRAPHSYTGEELIEISCHGGDVVANRIQALLCRPGAARSAQPGEFTQRAFLNGKLDLAQAEAVEALIAARSTAAARAALRVLRGGLRRALEPVTTGLIEQLAQLEAGLDIQEDGAPDVLAPARGEEGALRAAARRLERLLAVGERGRLLEDGVRIVIAGRPNAGKSSIFNALLARERAIVSPEAGTTRDTVEATVEWGGQHCVLVDTAGIGAATGAIEREGIARTREAMAAATLVLYVADVQTCPPAQLAGELATTALAPPQLIVAWHKWDRRPEDVTAAPALTLRDRAVATIASSVRGAPGIDPLRLLLEARVGELTVAEGETVLVGARQRELLRASHERLMAALDAETAGAGAEIVALEVRAALTAIGELLGQRVGPQVLERIFARFCVGK